MKNVSHKISHSMILEGSNRNVLHVNKFSKKHLKGCYNSNL